MGVRPFPELSPPLRDRLGPAEADLFEARAARWWPDFTEAVAEVYDAAELPELDADVAEIVARSFARRSPRLRRRDLERMVRPDWFAEAGQLGYAAYADRFAGDLATLQRKVGYLEELGVTVLQLLPLQTPRPEPNDAGQAVADHRAVRPDLGTVEDLAALAERLHASGMSLGLDVVVSHVAREHEWARRARVGRIRYRGAFHILSDVDGVDRLARHCPPAWPGNGAPFTWDDELRGWVWTTFHPWQWDLDWSNSDVFCASLDIMCFLANVGVDVLRLVGIPYAWKRAGTPSRDLPEVHALLQALRAALRIAAPSLAVAAPSAVTGEDPGAYAGRGRRAGREADVAFRHDVGVHVLSMLATRDTRLAVEALARVPGHPAGTTWAVVLRDHDEVAWRIGDMAAAAAALDGPAHRAFLVDFYTGRHPGSFARGVPFRLDSRARSGVDARRGAAGSPVRPEVAAETVTRVNGTLASLLGVDAALEVPPGPARERALDEAVARILLAHAIVLGWGGLPVLWAGDELGLRNDPSWPADPVRAVDSRWAHRPVMPWGTSPLGERVVDRRDRATVAGQVHTGLRHLARVRATLPQLHGGTEALVLSADDPGVLVVLRDHPEGPLLGLYNVTERLRAVDPKVLETAGIDTPAYDVLTGARVTADPFGALRLPPYAARWVVAH